MTSDDVEAEELPPHLAIVGGGLAGCAAAYWAACRGAKVTIINAKFPLGGTCIHTGAFPARILMTAATEYYRAGHPRFPGLTTRAESVNWAELTSYRRRLVADTAENLRRHVVDGFDNVELIKGYASFADPRTLVVNGRKIEPDSVLLTPGSTPTPPDIDGIDEIGALSMGELAELRELPERVIFLEASDASVVFAQLLARLGSRPTILTDKKRLFGGRFDSQITAALTEVLRRDGVEIVCGITLTHAETRRDGIRALGTVNDHPTHWDADKLVVVDHHRPRVEGLHLERGEIELSEKGYIVIDETLKTTNPIVYAAGDAIGRRHHAYAEAYDAVLAARNAISTSRTAGHAPVIPFAIYTDPELAGVGWDEEQAKAAGFKTETAVLELSQIPAGHALGYEGGFIRLCRDRRSDQLLGARILAPHAAELIMEVALVMSSGITTTQLANFVRPPISLGEAIGRAAALFDKSLPGNV